MFKALFLAIIAPIIAPFFDFLLSPVNVPSIEGTDEASNKIPKEYINTFIRSLTSAFIGNAIWGMTYGIQNGLWWNLYISIFVFSSFLFVTTKWKVATVFF